MRTLTLTVNGDLSITEAGRPVVIETEAADDSVRHDTPVEVQVAAACHEANRQYCRMLGDQSQLPWSQAPGWQQASAIEGVRGILNGTIQKPEDAHHAWMAHKLDAGWLYGPEKSEVQKTHPCLVPYTSLPPAQQRKDALFFAIANVLLGRSFTLTGNTP